MSKIEPLYEQYKRNIIIPSSVITKTFNYLKKEFIIEKIKHPFALVHGDPVAGNFIINKSKIYLIDWQSVKISDPAFEIWALTNNLFIRWDTNKNIGTIKKIYFLREYLKLRRDLSLIERIKIKESYWLLLIALYSVVRYIDFKRGKLSFISKSRKENFERYRKAYALAIKQLKILIKSSFSKSPTINFLYNILKK